MRIKNKDETDAEIEFRKDLVRWSESRYVNLCNSPASANLLALASLTSHIFGNRAVKLGDEIITTVGNPHIINSILQNGCIPVLVDVSISTHNTTARMVSSAITDKTKAIFLPHILGNPYNEPEIKEVAESNELWLLEDCTKSLGTKFENKRVGLLADIATYYLGGGILITNSSMLNEIIYSFGHCGDNDDFSHIGYDLKISEIQTRLGIEKLKTLDGLIGMKKENWEKYRKGLEILSNNFIFQESLENSIPDWHGFSITLKNSDVIIWDDLLKYLSGNGIYFEKTFGCDIRKPPYIGRECRIPDGLPKSDIICRNSILLDLSCGDKVLETIDIILGFYK